MGKLDTQGVENLKGKQLLFTQAFECSKLTVNDKFNLISGPAGGNGSFCYPYSK